MSVPAESHQLVNAVVLLGAAVIGVPLFKRLGLGSVLGYLAGGLAIGPFGLGFFSDPRAILHVAELGVVMFLFIIGLEMQPSRLWKLRGEIFGLGVAQVLACGALLTGVGVLAGLAPAAAFMAAMGFVLSSTAIVMQILGERDDTASAQGQRIVSILLLEDLAIVPLLALVALLAPAGAGRHGGDPWAQAAIAAGCVLALLAAGRWLLNPLFRLLAAARAREVMTAAALLVVLGAALLMELGGLSAAMGAFLAGVLLSESTFRHQLEAEIEPFRGILLGLFFLGVGMSLDLSAVAREWPLILAGVFVFMAVKAAGVYGIARLLRAPRREALTRAALLAQGGEFAFVLYSAAAAAGIFDGHLAAVLTAVVIISMALTPVCVLALRLLPPPEPSMDGVEAAQDLDGCALIIGFGRFGQIVTQAMLARGMNVSILDLDTDAIRAAEKWGVKVYYGDGTRADMLRNAGAETAKAILICIDDPKDATRIVRLAKAEFPLVKLVVRAYDRIHALALLKEGVDFQVRETLESALAFSAGALAEMGVPAEEAADVVADVRKRDLVRLDLEVAGGLFAGRSLLYGNMKAPADGRNDRADREALDEAAGNPPGVPG